MGHLLTKMTAVWLEQQTTNNKLKPVVHKRKRTDTDELPNKRKLVTNQATKTDSDNDDESLTLSPRISPLNFKVSRSSQRTISTTLFRCQLCRRYLKTKDTYMDHMIMCAIQRQASIKIVRAISTKPDVFV